MNIEQKFALITTIVAVHEREQNADEGDKHLASTGYAMEAISAVIDDWPESPIVREFVK